MIAAASQLADPRTRAKARLRAAARGQSATGGSQHQPRGVRAGLWRTLVVEHPIATVAAALGLVAVVGPIRIARLTFAAVRTASVAAGVARVVSALPSPGGPRAGKDAARAPGARR